MASVWGGSWGVSWGDAWGVVSGESSSGWRRLWLAAETQKALDARNAKRANLEAEESPELEKPLAKKLAKKVAKKALKKHRAQDRKAPIVASKPFVIGEQMRSEPSMYERIGLSDFFSSYSITTYKATIGKIYRSLVPDSQKQKREEEEFLILMAT